MSPLFIQLSSGSVVCRPNTTSCITNVDSNDRSSLSKLVESVKTNYNERGEEIKRHWGGCTLGNNSAAKVIFDSPSSTPEDTD